MLIQELSPQPPAPPSRLYPLAEKDPFGEWVNPHDAPDILATIETLPHDYDASVAFIRGKRPRASGPALQFWMAPISRAHFLNAMLLRGKHSVVQVHQHLDLANEKIYAFLPRWSVEFRKRRREVHVQDGEGRTYAATVEAWNDATGYATLRLDGYNLLVDARHMCHVRDLTLSEFEAVPSTLHKDKVAALYRTAQVIALDNLQPVGVLSLLTGLTKTGILRLVTSELRATGGEPLVSLAAFEAVVPRWRWLMTLEQAQQRSNPCRCVFWDLQRGDCGLGNALPAAGPKCEDYEAEEVPGEQ